MIQAEVFLSVESFRPGENSEICFLVRFTVLLKHSGDQGISWDIWSGII